MQKLILFMGEAGKVRFANAPYEAELILANLMYNKNVNHKI
jgi:hypothetical protein